MHKKEQQQFAAFFQEIYETQQLLDYIKIKLTQSPYYNPNLLFDLISQKNQVITINQLRVFLNDKVACNQRQLYQIFQRFDWSRQGKIIREDFINEILPYRQGVQSVKLDGGSLTSQIQGHFISLIVQILKRFRICEVVRKQLKYIQPYDAFEHLDYMKTGNIGICQLRKIFYDNNFNVTDKELYFLLHGLRRRNYKHVNLQVFCQNLQPLEYGFYAAYRAQLDEEIEKEFLNRSRYEEETLKRSQIQAQRIQHEFQRGERHKQAEVGRHLQLQDRANAQILRYQQQKQRQIQNILLEDERNFRHNYLTDGEVLRQQVLRRSRERADNQVLANQRLKEQIYNKSLSQSAYHRQRELQLSRRALELQRQNLYVQELKREKQLNRSVGVAQQLERSRQRIAEESRRRYEELSRVPYENIYSKVYEENLMRNQTETLLRKQRQDEEYIKLYEQSRKKVDQSRKGEEQRGKNNYDTMFNQRQKLNKELEAQKRRTEEEISARKGYRGAEQEKELEKTGHKSNDWKSKAGQSIYNRSYGFAYI